MEQYFVGARYFPFKKSQFMHLLQVTCVLVNLLHVYTIIFCAPMTSYVLISTSCPQRQLKLDTACFSFCSNERCERNTVENYSICAANSGAMHVNRAALSLNCQTSQRICADSDKLWLKIVFRALSLGAGLMRSQIEKLSCFPHRRRSCALQIMQPCSDIVQSWETTARPNLGEILRESAGRN